MAEIVYALCALTSTMCAVLLFRGYRRTKTGLLLWSSLCFAGLALNNVLLFVDLVILPTTIDLSLLRSAEAVAAMAALLIGLIREARG